MPHKTWAVGEEVLAADFNAYVQNQVVAQFPNVAARNTWAAPPIGALSVTTDTGIIWQYAAGAWRAVVANRGEGRLASATVTANTASIGTSPTPITGASVTVSPPAGRQLRIQWFGRMATADTSARIKSASIDNGAGSDFQSEAFLHAGTPYTHSILALVASTGSAMTFRVRASISLNTCNTDFGAGRPGILIVEDVGPTVPYAVLLPAPAPPDPTPKKKAAKKTTKARKR